jgi:hypothetical protein
MVPVAGAGGVGSMRGARQHEVSPRQAALAAASPNRPLSMLAAQIIGAHQATADEPPAAPRPVATLHLVCIPISSPAASGR